MERSRSSLLLLISIFVSAVLNWTGTEAKINYENVVEMNQNVVITDHDGMQSQDPVYSLPSKYKSFAFASYYSDHMVLQKAPQRAVIWGYAANIHERIIIKMSERGIYKTHVYKDPQYGYGVWKIKLPAESSAGPFTITAISSEKTITLNNVMFGDVWVCSGQSNMQFSMVQEIQVFLFSGCYDLSLTKQEDDFFQIHYETENSVKWRSCLESKYLLVTPQTFLVYNATKELAETSSYPNIRIMTVKDLTSATPVPDLQGILEPWSLPSNATVGGPPFKYFSAVCWLYGKYLYQTLGYPIGLIDTSWGGTPVEAWSSRQALAKCGLDKKTYRDEDLQFLKLHKPVDGKIEPYDPSSLWNGMIHPFLNMTIFGAIWYQGEANVYLNIHKYICTFPTMIDDWREQFHTGSEGETNPLFPFGFVQLAANRPDSCSPGFPEIRWHQTADYGFVPNPRMKKVFMAVAMDLPDYASPWGSIHPRDKQDVAARLVLGALNVAYNHTGVMYQGPLPSTITTQGQEQIVLNYTDDVAFRNFVGFEVLCPVKNSSVTFWTTSPISYTLENRIVLYTDVCGQDEKFLALRYNWKESPCAFKHCTVYSAANLLPGPPFVAYRGSFQKGVQRFDWMEPVILRHHTQSLPVPEEFLAIT